MVIEIESINTYFYYHYNIISLIFSKISGGYNIAHKQKSLISELKKEKEKNNHGEVEHRISR